MGIGEAVSQSHVRSGRVALKRSQPRGVVPARLP